MIILPAIDIIQGKPVRLYQGQYDQKEIVGQNVLEVAKQFEKEGAAYLHLVDLDGAKASKRINHELIVEIAKNTSLSCEVGGGIRSMEDVEFYLSNGLDRIILGTSAIENPEFLKDALNKYGSRIIVGIDCKDGFVCTSGWQNTSQIEYIEFAKKLENIGVKELIFTDISKDGTLQGPNLTMLTKLKENVSCFIVASGGIKDINHIKQLKSLGVDGAITGKALYAHTLSLTDALQAAKEETC